MKRSKNELMTYLIMGMFLVPTTTTLANNNTITIVDNQTNSATITINISYLGAAEQGVSVSILKDNNVVVSAVSDAKGVAVLSVDNTNLGGVSLRLEKAGYQTQILTGLYVRDGAKYSFSLVKGEGVVETELSTSVTKIEDKSQANLDKIADQEAKAAADAEKAAARAESARA